MLFLFILSTFAISVSLLAGDYAGHGKESAAYALVSGARSKGRALALICGAAAAAVFGLFVMIWFLRLLVAFFS